MKIFHYTTKFLNHSWWFTKAFFSKNRALCVELLFILIMMLLKVQIFLIVVLTVDLSKTIVSFSLDHSTAAYVRKFWLPQKFQENIEYHFRKGNKNLVIFGRNGKNCSLVLLSIRCLCTTGNSTKAIRDVSFGQRVPRNVI